MKPVYWRVIPLIVFGLLVSFLWRGLSLDPQHLPSAQLGKPLPSFRLSVLGDAQAEFTPAMMRGHVTLLNIWASWCMACSEEQLLLMQLAREGIIIYGLNYKDNADEASKWLDSWGNPYRMVGEDLTGKVGIDLGVYGAPETFLVDKTGIIRYRHVGVLTEFVWQRELLPLMKQLEQTV